MQEGADYETIIRLELYVRDMKVRVAVLGLLLLSGLMYLPGNVQAAPGGASIFIHEEHVNAAPMDNVSIVYTITNLETDGGDNFAITVSQDFSPVWTDIVFTSTVNISAVGDDRTLEIFIKVPRNTQEGNYSFEVEAEPQKNRYASNSSRFTIHVKSATILDLDVEGEENRGVDPGRSVWYNVTAKNYGNEEADVEWGIWYKQGPNLFMWGEGQLPGWDYEFSTVNSIVSANSNPSRVGLRIFANFTEGAGSQTFVVRGRVGTANTEDRATLNVTVSDIPYVIVTDIELDPENPMSRTDITISATLENIGNNPANHILVVFYEDGKEFASKNITLGIGKTMTLDVEHSFDNTGDQDITVEVFPNPDLENLEQFSTTKTVDVKFNPDFLVLIAFAVIGIIIGIICLNVFMGFYTKEEMTPKQKQLLAKKRMERKRKADELKKKNRDTPKEQRIKEKKKQAQEKKKKKEEAKKDPRRGRKRFPVKEEEESKPEQKPGRKKPTQQKKTAPPAPSRSSSRPRSSPATKTAAAASATSAAATRKAVQSKSNKPQSKQKPQDGGTASNDKKAKKAEEAVQMSEQLLEKARAQGIDVMIIEKRLREAKSDLRKKEYVTAVEAAKYVTDRVKDLMRKREEAADSILDAKTILDTLKWEDIDLSTPRSFLTRSESALKKGDYLESKKYAEKAKTRALQMEQMR